MFSLKLEGVLVLFNNTSGEVSVKFSSSSLTTKTLGTGTHSIPSRFFMAFSI